MPCTSERRRHAEIKRPESGSVHGQVWELGPAGTALQAFNGFNSRLIFKIELVLFFWNSTTHLKGVRMGEKRG
jgi:hypothetical protein